MSNFSGSGHSSPHRFNEPPMFLQRPSSGRSQDVSHVLAKTFREWFTRDTVSEDTVNNLNISKAGDDPYHDRYVQALRKVQEERDRRIAKVAMLERHIMQAQARAMSADEREMNRVASAHTRYPDLGLPPTRSHFRSCLDTQLLREHHLLCPSDYSTEEPPLVPPPTAGEVPNYARPTTTSEKRSEVPDTAQSHFPAIGGDLEEHHFSSRSSYSGSEYSSVPDAIPPGTSDKSNMWRDQPSPEQREVNRKDILNLHSRSNFSKNPRISASSKSLTKGKKKKPKEFGIKSIPEQPTEETMPFIASPSVVRFMNYTVGQAYEATIELKNITSSMRQCRVIPPKTSYYSISLGQFPGEHGLVAPGMSCQYKISFIADSLGDYEDVITVQTQGAPPLDIPIQSRRPPPELTLPEVIDTGHCLVGGVRVAQFKVKNTGGPGRFCLMPRKVWPAINFKTIVSPGAAAIGPFEVRPAVFQLNHGDCMVLEVIFRPGAIDTYSEQLAMVCDNCQVQYFTLQGEGQVASVEFMSVEGGETQPLPEDVCDVTASHHVTFNPLNPFTYFQKAISIKNATNVELPFNWRIVKPHLQAPPIDGSAPVAAPENRIIDLDSAFSIEPPSGSLAANGSAQFTLTFAPPELGKFHDVLHLVLDQIPNYVPGVEQQELPVEDVTALEVELKGEAEPFNILVQPYAIYIPGKQPVGSSVKRPFKLINNSHSGVFFEWEKVTSPFIVEVEPPMGELGPGQDWDCVVSVTGAQPGKIEHTLQCRIENHSEPITMHIEAEIKGPEIKINNPDVNFGLVRFGESSTQEITLCNMSQIAAAWRIEESTAFPQHERMEFTFQPSSGELKPLTNEVVKITYNPTQCTTLHTAFDVYVKEGNQCTIAGRGEVKRPEACLLQCGLELEDVYVDVPVIYTVDIVNQTQLDADFQWMPVSGSQSEDCSVMIEPEKGVLGPREQRQITVHFTAHKQVMVEDVQVVCCIKGMVKPLVLTIKGQVLGMNVIYKTPTEGQDLNTSSDKLIVEFGDDAKLGVPEKRYVYIENTSAISAPFSIYMEHFYARPPTPPKVDSHMPNKSQRRAMLGRTPNLADPMSRTTAKAQTELCAMMLSEGRGAAFAIQPASGVLPPFGTQMIEVMAYSDMWGDYKDKMICKIEKLDLKSIDVHMNVVGCPLNFQVSTKAQPIVRFGTHVSGVAPVVRQMRINNSSPYDVRLDWEVYNVEPEDDQLLDFNVTYGVAFPLRDKDGVEIEPVIEGPPPPERLPTEFIPNSPDSTMMGSRLATEAGSVFSSQRSIMTPPQKQVVFTNLRAHEGIMSTTPYKIVPSQLVIPARGCSSVNVVYTPYASGELVQDGKDCIGFAQGFMSLDGKADTPNKVVRKDAYDMTPLRIDMTAFVKPALLTIECAEDEGMRYRSAASDLLQEGTLREDSLRVCGATIGNLTETPLVFQLTTEKPFVMVDTDPLKPNSALARTHSTEMITLKPQHNMQMKIAFQVDSSLLEQLKDLEIEDPPKDEEQKENGVTLQMCGKERRLNYVSDLIIKFNNSSIQRLPLHATLTVPSLHLSTDSLDFGTCLVGQERQMQVVINNPTRSSSFWMSVQEEKSDTCVENTFTMTPSSGLLDAHITHASKSNVLVKVHFIAKHTEMYEATFLLHGLLGEEPRRLLVRGQGSYDGKHEAFVNQ
ncbi:unnamed protein product [Owenia fusiformis]|uniref:Deleted in lung and esophageal cancer protein 1 n=1 Tax=Owenia fusiformis TaxID=6347 RepID=A0A8J1UGH5_OWEFU|nr:unnamed protein product [Owenia fusiformis]